ncbi:MAG: glutaredoxin family protein [Noviherbaspirillum sp.]|mgnify:CR=1 FL=1
MTHFTLYSRSYCHLCEDMLQALHVFADRYTFTVEMIDVDQDEGLVAQYDELVPVLFGRHPGNEPVRLCHYFLDESRLLEFFRSCQ